MRATAARSGSRYFSQSEFAMKALAQETGRALVLPGRPSLSWRASTARIAEELATQYALGYTSKNPKRDGAFRRVVVRVADHPGARTRTRSGYQSAARRSAWRRLQSGCRLRRIELPASAGRNHNERRDRDDRAARRRLWLVAWVALLVAAPLLPAAPAALIYVLGSRICHQISERSFHVDGAQLPVCARCLGIYAGFARSVRCSQPCVARPQGSDPTTPRPPGSDPVPAGESTLARRQSWRSGAVPTRRHAAR